MLFSESGDILSFGSGADGQLGLGNSVYYQSRPKRLRLPYLRRKVVQINAGEAFSAAITGI